MTRIWQVTHCEICCLRRKPKTTFRFRRWNRVMLSGFVTAFVFFLVKPDYRFM